MAPNPPEIVESLGEGQAGNALNLIAQAKTNSPWATNALGLCLLRLGNAKVAVDVFRGLVLAAGGILLRNGVLAVFKTRYATALLLADYMARCFSALAQVKEDAQPAVGRLVSAIRSWREGRPSGRKSTGTWEANLPVRWCWISHLATLSESGGAVAEEPGFLGSGRSLLPTAFPCPKWSRESCASRKLFQVENLGPCQVYHGTYNMLHRRGAMRYERALAIAARLDKLIEIIRSDNLSSPELAKKLGVSEQTVYRDIDFLKERGYSIRSEKDADGWGYRLLAEPAAGSNEKDAKGKGMK